LELESLHFEKLAERDESIIYDKIEEAKAKLILGEVDKTEVDKLEKELEASMQNYHKKRREVNSKVTSTEKALAILEERHSILKKNLKQNKINKLESLLSEIRESEKDRFNGILSSIRNVAELELALCDLTGMRSTFSKKLFEKEIPLAVQMLSGFISNEIKTYEDFASLVAKRTA
jgi:galactokinase